MKKTDKPRVVIDTNLFVSAILVAGSLPDRLLKAWKKDLYTLVVSPDIIEETKEVFQSEYLRKKYNLELLEIERLLTSLRLSAELSTPIPVQELPIHCRDLKDDRLLALAFGGNAQYLITGDKDLLILNGNRKLGKLKIMTVKEFLSVLRF